MTLTTGSPSALAEELLDDRRTVARWFLPMSVIGVAVGAWLMLSLHFARGDEGARGFDLAAAVICGLLTLCLVGLVRMWRGDWVRLQAQCPDAALKPRARMALLSAARGKPTAVEVPEPLLIELTRGRIQRARPYECAYIGFWGAYGMANLTGFGALPRVLIALIALSTILMVLAIISTEREIRHCRRFLQQVGVSLDPGRDAALARYGHKS